ncbi:MAG: glycosyl transferase [Sphingomonas sp.]|nr:MAG: glycosyl transferase [Sphingomonas sp.]
MIPKIVHLCWLSGDPYPDLIRQCVDSWSRHLPDYEIRLWDAASIGDDFPQWVSEATSVRKYAFAADFIRLYALYNLGGIYLDADVQIVGSLNSFLTAQSFMGRETGGDLEPAVIGAVPGQPWIKSCLDYYVDRPFLLADGKMDTKPLPVIVGETLESAYGLDLTARSEIVRYDEIGLTLYPDDFFSPKNRFSGKVNLSSNTVAIHHFDGQWVEKGTAFYLKNTIHAGLLRTFGSDRYISIRDKIRKLK